MSRFSIRATRLCALAVLLALMLLPAVASAKDFSIEGVSIAAAVDPNGDLGVTEQRTVKFDGQFSWVEWNLKNKGSQGVLILGVSTVDGEAEQPYTLVEGGATQPGTYSVINEGDSVIVRVAISALDQTLAFRIRYRALQAAQRYLDASEFYWQFIGAETGVPTGPVHIEITPPAALRQDQVNAWAHGPLTGNVAIGADGKVTLDVPKVPANTFVEARILYPSDALSGATAVDAARSQEVHEEEARLANQANAERGRARLIVGFAIALSALLSFGGLAYAVSAFLRHGREYRAVFAGIYLREDPRPDLPPGVVGALWRFGAPGDADIAATLMDLADKGAIALRPTTVHHDGILGIGAKDEPSFELGRNPKLPGGAVNSTDQILLGLLFDDIGAGGMVTLEEIKSYAKDNPKLYTDRIKQWADESQSVADSLGMFETASRSWRVGMFVLAAFVGAVGFFSAVWAETLWPVLIAVPSAIAIAVMGVFMLRRTPQGNELFEQYKAVRDYLRDFGRLHEVPPQSIVLWNRFLVLAVIFGIATEVINQLRVTVPAVISDPAFQTTYWWVYSGGGSSSPVSALQGGFASASQIATSAMSSSSGGGGGFSGGGGGGGGGGGFSAG